MLLEPAVHAALAVMLLYCVFYSAYFAEARDVADALINKRSTCFFVIFLSLLCHCWCWNSVVPADKMVCSEKHNCGESILFVVDVHHNKLPHLVLASAFQMRSMVPLCQKSMQWSSAAIITTISLHCKGFNSYIECGAPAQWWLRWQPSAVTMKPLSVTTPQRMTVMIVAAQWWRPSLSSFPSWPRLF